MTPICVWGQQTGGSEHPSMAAWAEGMLSLSGSLTYLTRDARTPQDRSAPQAASLQSACSLGLYKRYFLVRTIVGILEMPGDKTLHSMPGTTPLPSQKWGCFKQARLGCEPSAMAFPLFCSLGQVPVLQASVYLLCSPTIPHPMLWYSLLAPRQFFS